MATNIEEELAGIKVTLSSILESLNEYVDQGESRRRNDLDEIEQRFQSSEPSYTGFADRKFKAPITIR